MRSKKDKIFKGKCSCPIYRTIPNELGNYKYRKIIRGFSRGIPLIILTLVLILSIASLLWANSAEDSLKLNAPKVYIDCEWCDMDFIKTEMTFVNYVIDRAVADVHVLITIQETASGGTEHTIIFIGQHAYEGMNDTLKHISGKTDSDDIIRRGIVQKLKLGLVRFIARTTVADEISISTIKKTPAAQVLDEWHNWVFSISIKAYLNGEELAKYNSIYSSFSANRITSDWKIRNSIYYDYYANVFEINDTSRTYTSKSYGVDGLIVRSLSEHWSGGLSATLYSSTYNNIAKAFSIQPAAEYNIFPYRQSTNRELRILYNPGYKYYQYIDTTIYDKTEEILFFEYLSITLDTKQRWGSISTTISGSHYLHDLEKNRLSLYSNLSLPIIKGLSFSLSGWISLIHDQLSLSKEGLTPDEIFLRIKQQATQYNYYASIGLTYSFGSLYSNIVNPRFGD